MVLSKKNIMQFVSYFFVGGCAAIVEWVMFFIFATLLGLQYMLATALAFVFSTTTNLILGKIISFKESSQFENRKLAEAFAIFFVSAIGLLFNIGLMYLFVQVIGLDTDFLMTFSKICATGIVFIWNFLIRKLVIYKV